MSSFEGGTFGGIPSPIEGQEETPILVTQQEEQPQGDQRRFRELGTARQLSR